MTILNDIKMRLYNVGDEDKIVNLLKLVFNNWPHFDLSCSPIDHWKWKYAKRPNQYINIYLAEHNSLIVGNESRIPLQAKVGKKILYCEQRGDLSVHPDYRGKGIFKKMHTATNDSSQKAGVMFSYAIEGNPIVIKYLEKRGVPTLNKKVKNLFWINNYKKFLEKYDKKNIRLHSFGIFLYKLWNKIRYILFINNTVEETWVINNLQNFDDRFDDFWKMISKNYDYILVRNSKYLNWRYCDPRAGTYNIKAIEESGKILGYVVLRINKYQENSPTGHIVDIQALPYRTNVLEALIQKSLKFFLDAEINQVNCWLIEDHPYVKSFKKYGFLDIRQQIYFDFIPYNIDDTNLQNIIGSNREIYISMGDSDII